MHSTIGTTPSLASKDPSLVKVQTEASSSTKPKFKIGIELESLNLNINSRRVTAGTGCLKFLKL